MIATNGWQPATRHLGDLADHLETLAESPGPAEAAQALREALACLLPERSGTLWLANTECGGWSHGGGWQQGASVPPRAETVYSRLPWAPEGAWCLVLGAHGVTAGELRVEDPVADADEAALLRALAAAGGTALAGHLLRRQVRHRNVRDPLTGLFNRRYLEDTLERELHRARRADAGLTLIRLEVDGLEALAHQRGPEPAERMLQAMADTLSRSFRGSDVCCRASETGFGLLLPEAALADGVCRSDAVREELAELRLGQRERAVGPLGVSAGIAAYPEHGDTAAQLLEAAERAVHHAQQLGGDDSRVAELIDSQTAS